MRRLGIAHVRTLKMQEDVLCVRVSPNGAMSTSSHSNVSHHSGVVRA